MLLVKPEAARSSHRASSEVQRVPRTARPQTWLAWIPAVVLLALVVRSAWVADDAYITLRTVDNFVHGYGMRWNVGERVQAFTHPLWMFALTLVYSVLREEFGAAVSLGVCATCAGLVVLHKLARTPWHAAVAILLLAASRTYVDFSTSGLENPLSHLLLGGFIYCYLVRRDGLSPLAVLSALIALNRSDALLLVLPALAHETFREYRASGLRQTATTLTLGFAPVFAWELVSLVYYGSLVPNTAFAKLNTGISQAELLVQGAIYVKDTLAWDLPLLPILALGLAVAFSSRQLRQSLIAAGALLYVIYVVRIGGDFMMGRFLTLPLFAAVCLIATAELPLDQPAAAGLVFAALALLFLHPNATERWPVGSLHHDGVADERAYYRDNASLMMWTRVRDMPNHVWVGAGHQGQAGSKRVVVWGNVGFYGFFAGPSLHIVDENALTDPLLARLPARVDPFWRSGHQGRDVPKGYVATLESGTCQLEDRDLCAYYEKLREVVAGDLWSWRRLLTIAGLNLGWYDHWIDRDRYRYPGRLEIDFEQLSDYVAENAAWNSRNMRVIPNSGALVRLSFATHVAMLQLALDGNDDYLVEFRRGKERLGEVRSRSLWLTGAHTREIAVPEAAAARGFDRILVRPSSGDNAYSLGHLRLCL